MRVQIKVTVEVDPAEWAEEYGCERSEVRDDVRSYFVNQITQAQGAVLDSLTVRVA